MTMDVENKDTKSGDFIRILLSVLLPPVGVALEVGFKKDFWINVILTLFGFLPGVIHAVYIIAKK